MSTDLNTAEDGVYTTINHNGTTLLDASAHASTAGQCERHK